MIESDSLTWSRGCSWSAATHESGFFSDDRYGRALFVYQNADVNVGESEVNQLYTKARLAIPAVMNYLYFSTAQVAVVYFGKRVEADNTKMGIADGAEDLKIKLIRYLMSEVWPPLLRTDAPDESLGNDFAASSAEKPSAVCASDNNFPAEVTARQEQSWLAKSLRNRMQVLIYVKKTKNNGSYVKVFLNNSARRLYFDVIHPQEEKYRWDQRMLYTRIMDNLETQKAIDSYESYEYYFRLACATAAQNAVVLERPLQAMLSVTMWPDDADSQASSHFGVNKKSEAASSSSAPATPDRQGPPAASSKCGESHCVASGSSTSSSFAEPSSHLRMSRAHTGRSSAGAADTHARSLPCAASETRSYFSKHAYAWMDSLQKPESTTLDYKSYFSYTAEEVKRRSVKFMCGFLNAYQYGKLVIGVHEIPRRCADGSLVTEKEGKNTIVLHNDLVDQYVVGVRISTEELEDVQEDVSQQLLCCIPPIPPKTVHIDVIPVQFPSNFRYSNRVLILYDDSGTPVFSRDALKQKSNFIIRFLFNAGLTVVPLDLVDGALTEHIRAVEPRVVVDNVKAEAYVIAAIRNPAVLDSYDWETALVEQLATPKTRCKYLITPFPADKLTVAPLHVVEVSVDLQRCGCAALMNYRGKFFNGWPSIPIWDATTKSIGRVERNYNIMNLSSISQPFYVSNRSKAKTAAVVSERQHDLPAPLGMYKLQEPHRQDEHASALRCSTSSCLTAWYTNAQIAMRVLLFLYSPNHLSNILHFRLIHPMCNAVFENRQGTHLIEMLHRTPIGVPLFTIHSALIASTQYAFLNSGIPPMPLLLCRVFEIIGNLPSPYPFVAVPLVQQSFRVARFLLPIFYHQHYYDGQLNLAVVLDLRDGILKTVRLRDGNFELEAIAGMGFAPLHRRQLALQLSYQSKQDDLLQRYVNTNAGARGRVCSRVAERFRLAMSRSFLARRLLQPRMLRRTGLEDDTGSLRAGKHASLVLSPVMSEVAQDAQREVEENKPVVHFSFLTVRRVELEWTSPLLPSTSAASMFTLRDGSARPVVKPWTLQHLLSWYNALLTDEAHVNFFGYCKRSLAFHIDALTEVCTEDIEPGALGENNTLDGKQVHLCSSQYECTLHRKVREWMSV